MLINLVLLAVTAGSASTVAAPAGGASYDRPRVEVWTNRGDDPFRTGQRARVFLRADRDAFVTLFRVDTDGRVRILFPHDPWEDNFVRGGRDFEVAGSRGGDAFDIDDYPGVGYLFAIAAADPYQYEAITSGDHWDYRVIAEGRVRGDPYVALTDLAVQMLPQGYDDWDYDIVPYYVQQHYDYPRFLCYDCHHYASYTFWDPYAYSCVRFRIVVYDDPYYYPYRYYGGRRVVFTRPLRPEPRYIFKDRGGVGDDRFVTRERQRPVNDTRRRGVRSADVGGRGSVPVPRARPRQPDGRTDNPPRRDAPRRRDDSSRHDPVDGRQQPSVRPDQPNRPDGRDPARSNRRSNVEPQRRPDPPARADDTRRGPAERPSRPAASPQRGEGRTQASPRQAPTRQVEPRTTGRKQPARAAPRSQSGRRSQAAPAKGTKDKGQPQLKRRRP